MCRNQGSFSERGADDRDEFWHRPGGVERKRVARGLEGFELAPEQGGIHVVAVTGRHALGDQIEIRMQENEFDLRADDKLLTISLLERGTGENRRLASSKPKCDCGAQGLQPGGAVSVGERNTRAHLGDVGGGMEVVVAVTAGKLDFGPWEQIFYGEFDGRRKKRVLVKIIGE